MIQQLFVFLIAIGVAQALFLIVVLVRPGKNTKLPSQYLALLILVFALILINQLLIETEWITTVPLFFEVANMVPFTIGPTLYLYTCSVIKKINREEGKPLTPWIHFVPFLIAVTVITILYLFTDYATSIRNPSGDIPLVTTFLGTAKGVHIFTYLFLSFYLKYQFSRLQKRKLFSSDKANITWLTVLPISFLVAWVFALFDFVFNHFQFTNHPLWEILPNAQLILILYPIAYVAIKNPFLKLGNSKISLDKYTTSPLTQMDKKKIERTIRTYFNEHEIYTDSELNLQKFSELISVPKHHISETLNEQMKISFLEFCQLLPDRKSQRFIK